MAEKKDTESARLGAILARQRAATKQDQKDIARTLAVSAVTVGRWERGLSKPELWRRADVERAYGLPLGAIGGVTRHNTDAPPGTTPRLVGLGPDAADGFLEAAERMSQTVAGLIRDARALRAPVASATRATPTKAGLKIVRRRPSTGDAGA